MGQSSANGTTPLERFRIAHRLRNGTLARESGYSRQYLLQLRMGTAEPSARCREAVTAACRKLARKAVRVDELFDVEGREA